MAFRVVLTGGIASGKTAAAAEFAALGIPVIDTDQVSRDIVAPGSDALASIVASFGTDVLDSTGQLDRRRMRERVFSDPGKRKQLEAITHPAIRTEVARRSAVAAGPYQIHAIPLYVETGAKGGYDRVLVVDTPEFLQLERLAVRDGTAPDLARKILAAQATREQRLAIATDIIANDGSRDDLRAKVRAIHEKFLRLAQTASTTGV
jgi:dephospho-CoA kinase